MSNINLVKNGYNFRISEDSDRPPPSPTGAPAFPSPEEIKKNEHVSKTLLTAPKGKPRAPPLIHERVKPADVEVPEVNHNTQHNGESAVPLKKSKSSSSEFKNDLPKGHGSVSGASTGSRTARSKDSASTVATVGSRSVEKVKISKGIEMKRVVQDASRVKSKSRVQMSRSPNAKGPISKSKKMTMTKTVTVCPDVKVKRFLEERETSKSSKKDVQPKQNSATKLPQPQPDPPSIKKENEPPEAAPAVEPKVTVSDTAATAAAAGAGASLEEFLKMPETNLPETQSQPNTTASASTSAGHKKLYKSKFWEYLNPKSDSNSKKKGEQKKPYNPDEVKSYMQKQKEARRQEIMKKSKEKQEEQEKRQRMLRDLESKYQKQRAQQSKVTSTNKASNRPADHEADGGSSQSPPKKSRLDSESPSLKYLKPLLERKQGDFLRRSDSRSEAAKQAQHLLSEFESIVKRECMSFIKQIPKAQQTVEDTHLQKADKAVGTSSPENEFEIEYKVQVQSPKGKPIPSPATVEKAAMRIQALYRGYKVRKALKLAKINLRKSFLVDKTAASSRRWSLPAPAPERPYTSSKLQPMSPIPFGPAFNPARIPSYIPPPSPTPAPPPRASLTPVRLRTFDEPYPKAPTATSTPQSLLLPKMSLASMSVGVGTNFDQIPGSTSSRRLSAPPSSANFSLTRTIESLSLPQPHSATNLNMNYSVPSAALPSVLDAFREKLHLFKNRMSTVAPTSSQEGIDLKPSPSLQDLQFVKLKRDNAPASTTYTTDFESVSDTNSSTVLSSRVRTTVSDEIVETPKARKSHRHRSQSHSHSHHRSHSPSKTTTTNSTTAGETDEDYASSGSRAHGVTVSASEKTLSSSSELPLPTASTSLGGLMAPALRLRYEAEKERLLVLEKALNVSLKATPKTKSDLNNVTHSSQRSDNKKNINTASASTSVDRKEKMQSSESVQYAIAKVQKESMRAAAEMAKWMAEFQRNTQQLEQLQTQKSSADLAAIVYKAVEEARLVGEEKRKQHRHRSPKKVEMMTRQESSSQSELTDHADEKEDKSVQTSLLQTIPMDRVEREEQCKPEVLEKAVEVPDDPEEAYSGRSMEVNGGSLSAALSLLRESLKESSESEPRISVSEVASKEKGDSVVVTDVSEVATSKVEEEEEAKSESVAEEFSESFVEDLESSSQNQEEEMPKAKVIDLDEISISDPGTLGKEETSKRVENEEVIEVEEDYEDEEPESEVVDEAEMMKAKEASIAVDVETDSVAEQSFESIQKEDKLEKAEENGNSSASVTFSSIRQELLADDKSSSLANEPEQPKTHELGEEVDVISKNYSEDEEAPSSSHQELQKVSEIEEETESVADEITEPESESPQSIAVEKPVEELGGSKKSEAIEIEAPESPSVLRESLKPVVDEEQSPDQEVSRKSSMEFEIEDSESVFSDSKLPKEKPLQLSPDVDVSTRCETKVEEESLKEELQTVPEQGSQKGADEKKQPVLDDVMGVSKGKEDSIAIEIETESVAEELSESVRSQEQEKVNQNNSASSAFSSIRQEIQEDKESSSTMKVEEEEEAAKLESELEEAVEQVKTISRNSGETEEAPSSQLVVEKLSENEDEMESISENLSESKSKSVEPEVFEEQTQEESGKSLEVEASESVSAPVTEDEEKSKVSEEEIAEEVKAEVKTSPKHVVQTPFPQPEVPVFVSRPHSKLQDEPPPPHPYPYISEMEIPLKPPPPYSPSSSLDSTSISSRSVMISVAKEKLESIVTEQVDLIWDVWNASASPSRQRNLPSISEILLTRQPTSIEQYSCPNIPSDTGNPNHESVTTAIENFDSLLWHLVYDTIRESLQGESYSLSLIERVRPGPLALQAQSHRVPRTKELLISNVLQKVLKVVPPTFFRDFTPDDANIRTQPKSKKWCSRPRELVDEILLEELEKENYQWTEWWPEEKIIIQNATNNIIKSLVRNALEKRNYVYEQGWAKCLSFKYDVIRK